MNAFRSSASRSAAPRSGATRGAVTAAAAARARPPRRRSRNRGTACGAAMTRCTRRKSARGVVQPSVRTTSISSLARASPKPVGIAVSVSSGGVRARRDVAQRVAAFLVGGDDLAVGGEQLRAGHAFLAGVLHAVVVAIEVHLAEQGAALHGVAGAHAHRGRRRCR